MVCVPDLDQAIETYRGLGFQMYPGGVHPGRGTHNAIAFFEDDYLELLAVRDPKEADAGLLKFLEAGEGVRYFIIASDDLDADVAAMRSRGADVTDVKEASRKTTSGSVLRWRYANLGTRNALPFFLIQHLTPIEERRAQVPRRDHPNGATGIAGIGLPGDRKEYERILGRPPETFGISLAGRPRTIRFRGDKVASVALEEAHGVALIFGR